MNTAAKVAEDKRKHPERYCAEPRCLWKIAKLDRETGDYRYRWPGKGPWCPDHYRPGVLGEKP